jgi:high-affinity Fe2+/Pb2+ permease
MEPIHVSDLVTQTDGKTTRKVTAAASGAAVSPLVTALVVYGLNKLDPFLASNPVIVGAIASAIGGLMAWAAGWFTRERARFGL